MAILVYCITENEPAAAPAILGVQAAPVSFVEASGLRCYVSALEPDMALGDSGVSDSALDFSRVLREIFRVTGLIPFRFPTILADELEAADFLEKCAFECRDNLARLKDKAQIDFRLSSDAGSERPQRPTQSGTEYMLRQRDRARVLELAWGLLRDAGAPWIEGWRQHDAVTGLRCYALVPRACCSTVLERVRLVQVPRGVQARITGPWPPAEFVDRE
jgi:hypothetical protein